MRLRGKHQRVRAVRRGFGLIVGRARDCAGRNEAAVALFVGCGLDPARSDGFDVLRLRREGVLVIRPVDPHKRLAGLHRLAGVHEAGYDLALHPKAEIALHARLDHARVGAPPAMRRPDRRGQSQAIGGPRVGLLLRLAGGEKRRCHGQAR